MTSQSLPIIRFAKGDEIAHIEIVGRRCLLRNQVVLPLYELPHLWVLLIPIHLQHTTIT